MWTAELNDGTHVSYPTNFLEIKKPIIKLAFKTNSKSDICVKNCTKYYMVFHAVAVLGRQGRVEKIEIGGLTKDNKYQGFIFSQKGIEDASYDVDNFPYKTALMPGEI